MLDFLRAGFRGDEGGVGGVDYYQVVRAEHGGEVGGFGEDDVVAAGFNDCRAAQGVAVGVGGAMARGRGPDADVVPVETGGEHDDVVGFFEEGVIDGDFGELGIDFFQDGGEGSGIFDFRFSIFDWALPRRSGGGRSERSGWFAFGEGGAHGGHGGGEFGGVLGEGGGDDGGAPDKHAGVPSVVAGGEIGLGGFEIGFFDEAFHAGDGDAVEFFPEGAALDVAEAGFGFVGADADGDHDGRGRGGGEGGAQVALVGARVVDDVVGGEDGEDALRVARGDERGGERDGGRGVASDGFGDDVGAGEFGADFAHGFFLRGAGDDEGVFRGDNRADAVERLREHGFAADDGQQVFGAAFAALGPEALAFSSGDDDCEKLRFGGHGESGKTLDVNRFKST